MKTTSCLSLCYIYRYLRRNVDFSTPENQPERYDIYDDYLVHSPEKAAQLDDEINIIILQTKLTNPANRCGDFCNCGVIFMKDTC